MSKNMLRICGIANQCVKECNHIKVTRDQLGVSFIREHGIVD